MELFGYLVIIFLSFYVMTKVVDEYFLKALDNIADSLKMSPSVAGATLLAVGTSAPELSTTMFALFTTSTDEAKAIGLGTVVGSALFQILVVIGFASLVRTTYLNWKPVMRDGMFYLVTIVMLYVVVQDELVTGFEGLLLLTTYVLYLVVLVIWSKFVDESNEPDPIQIVEDDIDEHRRLHERVTERALLLMRPIDLTLGFIPNVDKRKRMTIPVFLLCIIIIAFASYWLVHAAEGVANVLGIAPAIIALTILAGGSSIPELISSYIISKQGRGDMAISNAIGSNTFDILVSYGLPTYLFILINEEPAMVDADSISSSLILLFSTLLVILIILAVRKFKIGKKFGWVLILAYCLYVIGMYTGII